MRWQWGSTVTRVYSGEEEKARLAEEIIEEIKDNTDFLENKRNLKVRLLEGLLEPGFWEDGGDGFWFVWLMDRCRKQIRIELDGHLHLERAGLKALDKLLDEWEMQEGSGKKGDGKVEGRGLPRHHDTLYHVLCKKGHSRMRRASALIMQARRVRKGASSFHNLSYVSQRLIDRAKEEVAAARFGQESESGSAAASAAVARAPIAVLALTINPMEEVDWGAGESGSEREEHVGFMPPELFHLEVELQEAFCLVRFSNMEKVIRKIEEVERGQGDIEEWVANNGGSHRPDLIMKWWTLNVRQRVAAFCLDNPSFKSLRVEMGKVMEESPNGLKTYLNELKSRGSARREPPEIGDVSSEKGRQIMKMAGITIVRDFAEEWRKFYHREPLFERKKNKNATDDFSKHLKRLNRFIHLSDENFPIERPDFLKHAITSNQKQNRARSAKILGEISHARHMVMLHGEARSFPILELLHRLLVYRLWEESKEYKNWDSEPCFDIGFALRVLADIGSDMLSIVDKKREAGVRSSIGKSERAFEKIRASKGPYSLKQRLDMFHEEGELEWIDHRDEKADFSHILGFPILPKGESAYELLDPLRAFAGPMFVREDEDSYR